MKPVVRPSAAPIGARLIPASRGWAEVHPRYRDAFAAARLMTAEALLLLKGEIVSGHPDRHVLRVTLPDGRIAYLKRQHGVTWRERLKQKLAGAGWVSRCEREGRLLRELEKKGLPAPQCVAFGEDGDNRSFVLIEELDGCTELRQLLCDTALSLADRTHLAERLGQAVAELHTAGVTTPDLTAKHVFVDPRSFAVTLLDWQNARLVKQVTTADRVKALAGLDASLAESLAGPRERLRMLWAYVRVCRRSGAALPRFGELVRAIQSSFAASLKRRSIRDQRNTSAAEQRLVWLAGEAVCAIPEIAAEWPKTAVAPPFYHSESGSLSVRIGGKSATLIRGRMFVPFTRLVAAIRGKPWRSPGTTIGRILFHLQRYGIPAPQLFAFGQRATSRVSAEWFALIEDVAGQPVERFLASCDDTSRSEVTEQIAQLRKQLADAGCTMRDEAFRVTEAGRVIVGDPTAIGFTRT
jgi:tRNA A-37 threonylcarbamoyl transferase component Bud32